jgi:hypothetical protein
MPAAAGLSTPFQKWVRVTLKPGTASFATELPTTNWVDTALSMLAFATLSALAVFLGALGVRMATLSTLNGPNPEQQRAANQLLQLVQQQSAAAFLDIVLAPRTFYLVLVQELAVIRSLAPSARGFLSGVLGSYLLVLSVLATQASQYLVHHAIGGARAVRACRSVSSHCNDSRGDWANPLSKAGFRPC